MLVFCKRSLPGTRRVGAALLALLCTHTVPAAEPGGGGDLDLPHLIAIARSDNKDLRAACFAIGTARARLLQAGVRANPRLDLSARSDVLFGNEGEYAASVGISQQFPITDRLQREQDVARVDIALAEVEVQDAVRKLANEVTTVYDRILVIDRQLRARSALIAAQERLLQATRSRFKVAEVSELDVNTAQIDLQRSLQERALLQSQRQALMVSLNTLLGRPAESLLRVDATLPRVDAMPGLDELQRRATASRPDLHGALLAADRADADMRLARASRWEDWTVGLELSQDKQVITGAPGQGPNRALGVTVSIPLPLRNKGQGLEAIAQASGEQAQARVVALRQSIQGEVAGAHGEALRLQAALSQTDEKTLPISERSVRLAQQGYRQGLIPMSEVVQSQRQQSDLEATYVATLDQYLQALARLHLAVGDDVPASNNEALPSCDR